MKSEANGTFGLEGKTASSSNWSWHHFIRNSTYFGADTDKGGDPGFTYHRYSYSLVAIIRGHDSGEQNSVMAP